MKRIVPALLCVALCTGAECLQHIGPKPKTLADAPPGSIVGNCARDGKLIIIDACPNCRAACDFGHEAAGYAFKCNQCGRNFMAITCPSCGTNTYVSSGKFRIKER